MEMGEALSKTKQMKSDIIKLRGQLKMSARVPIEEMLSVMIAEDLESPLVERDEQSLQK